jgi:hypothetical protein
MGGKFTTTKLEYTCNIFTPKVQPQETNVLFLGVSCR